MIIARIVSGIGMGFINSTVPVMQAEFSPKATRGIYVCAQLSTLNFGKSFVYSFLSSLLRTNAMAGIMMVYWIDFGFSNLGEGANTSFIWRAPTILQCVFLIPMIFIIWIIPETPRWLAARDRNEEALEVLSRLNKGKMTEDGIRAVHCDIVNTVALEKSIGTGSWGDLLKNDSESL